MRFCCPRLVLVGLCVALVWAWPASARELAPVQHVRGKVMRFWERQLHTGTDRFLLDYRILRCGPRACVVRSHDRRFAPDDTFVEFKGTDACYAPKVRVRCFRRHAAPVATGP